MKYTEAFIQDLKDRVTISEVIGHYVSWDAGKSKDGDMWGCCPFHTDENASFHAIDAKGFYHCFTCSDVSGDHLEFLQKHLKIDFVEAIEKLAEFAGVQLPDSAPQGSAQRPNTSSSENSTPNPPPASEPEASAPKEPDGKQEIVKQYPYHSADGEVIYEVLRYQFKMPDGSWQIDRKTGNPKKTFRQRRPDGKGGFIFNLDGIGHTIYRHNDVEIAISESQTIYFVEGEKDADTLVRGGLCGTTNSSGAQGWKPHLAEIFKGADVVIIVDNDEPGIKAGEVRAASLKGIAGRIRVLNLADHVKDFPAKGDVTEWAEKFGGTADALGKICLGVTNWRPKPPTSKFRAVGIHELNQPSLQHEFLIDGFLDRQGVAMMPGASGSGKTFITMEVGMCVALGRKFWGMDTKQGLVIYQAGEGSQGAAKRIEGWIQDREVTSDLSEIPFKMLRDKVNLFVDDKDTDALIEEIKNWSAYFEQPVRMVVVDTFNKAITGANENAGQDMGKVMARLERISEELDCLVLVPMHKSKAGDVRGHTSLVGDACNVLNVSELQISDQNSRPVRTVALDKNKDGEKGSPLRFVLRQVVLPELVDGKQRTTCVVDRPNGDQAELEMSGRLSANQSIVLQTLRDVISRNGENPPVGVTGVPAGKKVATSREFLAELRKKWVFKEPENEPDKRLLELRRVYTDAGKRLQLAGFIDRDNDKSLIWWTGKEDRLRYVARTPAAPEQPPSGIPADLKGEDIPF